MQRLYVNVVRIAVSIVIALLGIAAGPVAALVTVKLFSSGEGEDWGALAAVFFYAPVALVIGAGIGIGVVIYSLRKIWPKQRKRAPSFGPLMTVGLVTLIVILVGCIFFSVGYFVWCLMG